MQILDFFYSCSYLAKGPPLPWVREYWPMLFRGNIKVEERNRGKCKGKRKKEKVQVKIVKNAKLENNGKKGV
jgi:hypothetical protein